MIILGGFSRFPIFYSSDGKQTIGSTPNTKETIGSSSFINELNTYVNSLKGKFVVLDVIANIVFKSRFIINKVSINPQLKNTKEDVPNNMFVYPDTEPDPILNNVYTKGFTLKGGRNTVFVPLLSMRELTQKEADALLSISRVSVFSFDKISNFLGSLDIRYTIEKELVDNRIVIRLADPYVNGPYRVLIDKNLRVLDVDFCLSEYENLFLAELILSVRENGGVYHISGFSY